MTRLHEPGVRLIVVRSRPLSATEAKLAEVSSGMSTFANASTAVRGEVEES